MRNPDPDPECTVMILNPDSFFAKREKNRINFRKIGKKLNFCIILHAICLDFEKDLFCDYYPVIL